MENQIVAEHTTQLTAETKQEHIAKVNITNIAYTRWFKRSCYLAVNNMFNLHIESMQVENFRQSINEENNTNVCI